MRFRETYFAPTFDKFEGRMIDAQAGLDETVGAWDQELQQFRRTRLPYLRYR